MFVSNGPVFIRSNDSLERALSVAEFPPPGQVTFADVGPDNWDTPQSQWVVSEVGGGVYRIRLFSGGEMFLTASAATEGAPVNVTPADPTNELQLWNLESSPEPQYLTPLGAPGLELGFRGEIPLPDLGLELTQEHDVHNLGDQFQITPVWANA